MTQKEEELIREWFIENKELLYKETIDELTLGEYLHKPKYSKLSCELAQALRNILLNNTLL